MYGLDRLSIRADSLVVSTDESLLLKTGTDAVISKILPSTSWWVWVVFLAALFVAGILVYCSFFDRIRRLKVELDRLSAKQERNTATISMLIQERALFIKTLVSQYKFAPDSEKGMSFMDYVDRLRVAVNKYQDIISSIRNDTRWFPLLEAAINDSQNNIIEFVRHRLGDTISEEGYHIIVGSFAGMSPSSMAFLLGINSGTVRVKKYRIRAQIKLFPDSKEKISLLKNL